MDWQRGNIPYCELPPKSEEEEEKEKIEEAENNQVEETKL